MRNSIYCTVYILYLTILLSKDIQYRYWKESLTGGGGGDGSREAEGLSGDILCYRGDHHRCCLDCSSDQAAAAAVAVVAVVGRVLPVTFFMAALLCVVCAASHSWVGGNCGATCTPMLMPDPSTVLIALTAPTSSTTSSPIFAASILANLSHLLCKPKQQMMHNLNPSTWQCHTSYSFMARHQLSYFWW